MNHPPARTAAVAAIAALVFGSLVGLHAVQAGDGLVLQGRPAAALLLVVFAVLASMVRRLRLPAPAMRGGARVAAPALLLLALLLPVIGGRYLVDTGTLVLIYLMLASGLAIVVGLAGLLDLGYVAFYAVGAYATGILSTRYGFSFWECLPVAGVLAGFAGLLLGFPVLRLRGDYLAIVTLGFGEIIRIVLNNAVGLTNGPQGIGGIPRPTLLGFSITGSGPGSVAHVLGMHATPVWRVVFLYYLILGLTLVAMLGARVLRRLPIGRAWEAIREDEIAARALGIDVTAAKLAAFTIGATLAGFAGAFFAARASFISPESFTFGESATVLAIVVLGGMGSQFGTALAAIGVIGGGEVLRELLLDLSQSGSGAWAGMLAADIGQCRLLLFGAAMVGVMVWRPRGLVAGRIASVRL